MAKLLVELKEGSLLDLIGHQYIMSGKPQIAKASNLVDSSIARGDMKLLANLKDAADEAELEEALKKNNLKAFLKKYKEGEEEEKQPENNKPENNKPENNKPENNKPENKD